MNSHKVESIPLGDLIKNLTVQFYCQTTTKNNSNSVTTVATCKGDKRAVMEYFSLLRKLNEKTEEMWNTSPFLSWLTLIYKQKSHDQNIFFKLIKRRKDHSWAEALLFRLCWIKLRLASKVKDFDFKMISLMCQSISGIYCVIILVQRWCSVFKMKTLWFSSNNRSYFSASQKSKACRSCLRCF